MPINSQFDERMNSRMNRGLPKYLKSMKRTKELNF
jgi:hypothetical protein